MSGVTEPEKPWDFRRSVAGAGLQLAEPVAPEKYQREVSWDEWRRTVGLKPRGEVNQPPPLCHLSASWTHTP